MLRNPAVTAAIVGMRSAEQARGVLGALEFRLSDEEVAEIERFRQKRDVGVGERYLAFSIAAARANSSAAFPASPVAL